MKRESKRVFVGAGVAAMIAGVTGLVFTPSHPWSNGGCIVVGAGLIAEALYLGRKPRA